MSPLRRDQVAIGLVAAMLVALEIVWTRIFSAEFFYSFAFLVVSLAVLGLGLGALSAALLADVGHLAADWYSRALGQWNRRARAGRCNGACPSNSSRCGALGATSPCWPQAWGYCCYPIWQAEPSALHSCAATANTPPNSTPPTLWEQPAAAWLQSPR